MTTDSYHWQRPYGVRKIAQALEELIVEVGWEAIVEAGPLLAPSLPLSDRTPVTDGTAAILLSSADRGLPGQGAACVSPHVSDFLPMRRRDFVAFEGPERAIRQAYAAAGIGVGDLDFAEVHDCFTSAELLIYEAMGLPPNGRGGEGGHRGRHGDGWRPQAGQPLGRLEGQGPSGRRDRRLDAGALFPAAHGAGRGHAARGRGMGLAFNMGGGAVANYATIVRADL